MVKNDPAVLCNPDRKNKMIKKQVKPIILKGKMPEWSQLPQLKDDTKNSPCAFVRLAYVQKKYSPVPSKNNIVARNTTHHLLKKHRKWMKGYCKIMIQ